MAQRRICALQVFVYLLRACQPEVRKALVRESLDVLIPVLDKRMAAGVRLDLPLSTRLSLRCAVMSAVSRQMKL